MDRTGERKEVDRVEGTELDAVTVIVSVCGVDWVVVKLPCAMVKPSTYEIAPAQANPPHVYLHLLQGYEATVQQIKKVLTEDEDEVALPVDPGAPDVPDGCTLFMAM